MTNVRVQMRHFSLGTILFMLFFFIAKMDINSRFSLSKLLINVIKRMARLYQPKQHSTNYIGTY